MKAIWNNQIIAESDDTIVVENNHYFPPKSVNMQCLTKNRATYTCHWKGVCDYYDVTVDGKIAKNGAWMYPAPTPEAEHIRGQFAFWQGVEVAQ